MGKSPRKSELLKRLLTAVLLIPLVLWFLFTEKVQLLLLVINTALLGEWGWLIFRQRFSFTTRGILFFGGGLYIVGALWGLFRFYDFFDRTPFALLYFLLTLWMTDTGAYFIGSSLKGPKIAPAISPNKTWSGAVGGFLCALLLAVGLKFLEPFAFLADWRVFLVLTAFISGAGQLGDLAESYMKRRLAIKDTSSLLPGHGGFLDRLDSLLGASFLFGFFSFLL